MPVQRRHGGLCDPDTDKLRVGVIAPRPGQQHPVDLGGVHPGSHQDPPRLVDGHQLPGHSDVEDLHGGHGVARLQLRQGQAEDRQPGLPPDHPGGIAPGVHHRVGPEATCEAGLSKSSLLLAEVQRRYVGGGVLYLYLVVKGNTHQQMEREGGGHLDQLPLPVPGRGVALLPSLELQLANSLL